VAILGGTFDDVARAIGVTRVARVTDLDRTGVEVACAIRPSGHVLQVCNGKGESFEAAAAGALLEAAELWASERVEPSSLRWGSLRSLSSERDAWGPDEMGSAGAPLVSTMFNAETRFAWLQAKSLSGRRQSVWVPAQAVYCPRQGISLGPSQVAWTSNGMGAHPNADAALLHALLEAIERHELAQALPRGFTQREVAQRLIHPGSLAEMAPKACALAQKLDSRGFDVFFFDLTPDAGALGLPVTGALLVDREEGPVPLTAGYACRLSPDESLWAALLEAAQSRLTDIHGARDDVAPARREEARALRALCAGARPGRQARALLRVSAGQPSQAIQRVLASLRRAGFQRAAAISLSPPKLGISIFKVILPQFQVSTLL
jgi:ribosomal protein S12 methylthiotransferase accessory factor